MYVLNKTNAATYMTGLFSVGIFLTESYMAFGYVIYINDCKMRLYCILKIFRTKYVDIR